MRNYQLTIIALASAASLSCLASFPVQAQFSYRRTVGDETENQYQPGGFFAIKYRGSIIGGLSATQNSATAGNLTRHSRLSDASGIGGATGIGGSTLQTESVTSESRSALQQPSSISTGTPLIGRPALNIQFGSAIQSPALKSFKVEYPSFPEADPFGRVTESFTKSSTLSSPGNSSFSSTLEQFQFGQ